MKELKWNQYVRVGYLLRKSQVQQCLMACLVLAHENLLGQEAHNVGLSHEIVRWALTTIWKRQLRVYRTISEISKY